MPSGSYPSTSPASFSRETSFLQQAVARGQTSLHGSNAANGRDESALDTDSIPDEDRGRSAGKRRAGAGGRLSRSSFSVDGRLSPTQEGEEEATASEGEGAQQALLPSRVRSSLPSPPSGPLPPPRARSRCLCRPPLRSCTVLALHSVAQHLHRSCFVVLTLSAARRSVTRASTAL